MDFFTASPFTHCRILTVISRTEIVTRFNEFGRLKKMDVQSHVYSYNFHAFDTQTRNKTDDLRVRFLVWVNYGRTQNMCGTSLPMTLGFNISGHQYFFGRK